MSKTVIKKRSKQKEIDPKFGVSEWDPAELDVRQTRHGTYESRQPPRGGTWRDQIKEEAYKLRQRHIHIQTVVKEVNKGIRCANL